MFRPNNTTLPSYENTPGDAYECVWTSSDKTVVWVDKVGKLTPVVPGKVTITMTLIDKSTGIPSYVVPVEVTVPEE